MTEKERRQHEICTQAGTDSFKWYVLERLKTQNKSYFKGLDFNYISLSLVNFSEADLRGTFFMHGTLYMANFWHANLEGAKLSGVILEGANLKDTKF